MKQTSRLLLLTLLVLLGACGKKGPLYLPPDKVPLIRPIPATPAEPLNKSESEDTDKTPPTDTLQP